MIKDLDDFKIYQFALKFGEEVWHMVAMWKYFDRDVIGKQLIRSADSIAANLSEGLGRYHFKDRRNFGYFSRGSLFETKTWLSKANSRRLISDELFMKFMNDLDRLGRGLNTYIKSVGPTDNDDKIN